MKIYDGKLETMDSFISKHYFLFKMKLFYKGYTVSSFFCLGK